MDKIILKDGTRLEFIKEESLNITFADKTIEELEKIFIKENCSNIQLATPNEEIYGIYNNLECISIIKNLEDFTLTVNLERINILESKVEQLQSTVDSLIISGLEG